jgi:hypothetical protein
MATILTKKSLYNFRNHYETDISKLSELDLIALSSKKEWIILTRNSLTNKDLEFFERIESSLKNIRKKSFCSSCTYRLGWNTQCKVCANLY